MLRIGIIGCGAIVRLRHAPECARNPEIQITGFCNRSVHRAEEMTELYGGKVYKSSEDLINDREIDAVIIATSNDTHAELSVKALMAGKHVLCEKPCVRNREELEQLENAVKKSHCKFMAAHQLRFLWEHMKAKQLLKDGAIGDVLNVYAEISHGGPEGWSIEGNKTWFLEKENSVCGVMGDLGIHKIDLIRWMLNRDIVSVRADLKNLDKKKNEGSRIGICDYALCQIQMEDGIPGTILASWCSYGGNRNQIVIYGTKGVLQVNPDAKERQIIIRSGNEKYEITVPKQKESGIAGAFAGMILEDRPSPVDICEVRKDMEAVFSCGTL